MTPEALDILQRALQRGNVNDPRRYLEKIIANLAGRAPAAVTLAPCGRPSHYVGWNARSLRKRLTLDEATALGQLRQF